MLIPQLKSCDEITDRQVLIVKNVKQTILRILRFRQQCKQKKKEEFQEVILVKTRLSSDLYTVLISREIQNVIFTNTF